MDNDSFLTNKSASNYSAHPDILVIINCVLNAPLMVISIIGNTLVLAAMLRTPSLRSPSMILLCSLAVSDLLVGLVVQPLYIAKELTEDLFVFRISYFMSFSSCGVSLCTVAAISLDRLAAIHYHMRYVTMVTDLGGEFLMELTLPEGSILTSCWIILSHLGDEFLMELMLSEKNDNIRRIMAHVALERNDAERPENEGEEDGNSGDESADECDCESDDDDEVVAFVDESDSETEVPVNTPGSTRTRAGGLFIPNSRYLDWLA
ncbi:hypothetical protein ACROYT_G035826 [Oculina patagonica]